MNKFDQSGPWLGRKSVRGAIVVLILLSLVLVFSGAREPEATEADAQLQQVTLITPVEYAGAQSLSLIGTVRAFSEAKVTAEKAGRITAVNVSLGQTVQAGQILATVENASEFAAVLQAEGVYEAALAAAEQSEVSLADAENSLQNAKNGAVSTFQSAYNTTNGVVRNTLDTFFADPDAKVPGLRIDGRGFTSELNAERVAYQTLLTTWQNKANTISASADLVTELSYAKSQVQRTISFVDTFLTVFAQQNGGSRYTDTELQGFITTFTGLRTTLIGTQSSIDGALSGLATAKEGVRRAVLGASGGDRSAADAQVKQALGTLRAAQANLAKTIFRTPISGTVNAISVRTGDFVNSFAPVAVVANNDALEIVTYISDSERDLIAEGDEVTVEQVHHTGIVTNIAPAVDGTTGKIEVRIATEGIDIVNGDTVRVTKDSTADIDLNTIWVPLSAVKFEIENGFVFLVEDGALITQPVELGVVRGGSVEIKSGLASSDAFVRDTRGLQPGTKVEVIN